MNKPIDLTLAANQECEKTKDIILGFPWANKKAYAMWLAQTFHMVNHSTRLVALAGAYAPLDRNDLHARFVDHSKEERGHQLICISDMKALGYKLEDFPCLAPSAAIHQVQYYWVQHRGAVSFFGYTLALECLAAKFGSELYRQVYEAHGKTASNFLHVHSVADLEHTDKALESLKGLAHEENELILENLQLSGALYRSMLIEVQSYLGLMEQKRAA
jgi:hypothetical protein